MPDIEIAADAEFVEVAVGSVTGFDLLEALHQTIDALESLVKQETALVRAGAIADIGALQSRKNQTAALYKMQATQLLSHAEVLRGPDNPFRAQLTDRTQDLRGSLADNRTAITAAKTSRFERIEAVMQAMRTQVANDSAYTRQGSLASERPRRKPVLTRALNAKI